MNPTKALPAEMSQWIKDRFYGSRALQYPYRSWLDMQSKAALGRRQPYVAASRMLHMWRQLGTEGFGADRVARLMEVVRENCYRDGELLPAADNRLRLEFIEFDPLPNAPGNPDGPSKTLPVLSSGAETSPRAST